MINNPSHTERTHLAKNILSSPVLPKEQVLLMHSAAADLSSKIKCLSIANEPKLLTTLLVDLASLRPLVTVKTTGGISEGCVSVLSPVEPSLSLMLTSIDQTPLEMLSFSASTPEVSNFFHYFPHFSSSKY